MSASLAIQRLQTNAALDAQERDEQERIDAHEAIERQFTTERAAMHARFDLYETEISRAALNLSGVNFDQLERNAAQRQAETARSRARALEELHASADYKIIAAEHERSNAARPSPRTGRADGLEVGVLTCAEIVSTPSRRRRAK